jgi:hypothetical protein
VIAARVNEFGAARLNLEWMLTLCQSKYITAIRINDIFNEFSSFEPYCYEKSTLEKVRTSP